MVDHSVAVEEFRDARSRVQQALQHLWTYYAKTPGYNKEDWKELGNTISAFEILARKRLEKETGSIVG